MTRPAARPPDPNAPAHAAPTAPPDRLARLGAASRCPRRRARARPPSTPSSTMATVSTPAATTITIRPHGRGGLLQRHRPLDREPARANTSSNVPECRPVVADLPRTPLSIDRVQVGGCESFGQPFLGDPVTERPDHTTTMVRSSSRPLKSAGLRVMRGSSLASAVAAINKSAKRPRGCLPWARTAE